MIQENDQYLVYEKMIDKINEMLAKFDEQIQENVKVAMLVGYTENGKSTIFNFLSGFEFQIKKEENNIIQQLSLKNPNEKFASDMAYGLKSVTKEPFYYFNKDNNYLLIDFPGFNDTDGAIQQSLISILFNRLVIKTPIRIIYVIKTLDGILPNRAIEFQKFITCSFAQHTQDFSQVTLVLNQYLDNFQDQDLIKFVKLSLKPLEENVNENIAVIRKIKDDSDLKTKFNEEKRQEIWRVIENSNPIKFKPTQFKKPAELAGFINQKCNQLLQNLVSAISQQMDNSLNKLDKQQLEALFENIYLTGLLIKNQQHLNVFCWYDELLKKMQEIAEMLGWQNNQRNEIDVFLKIFKFVSQEEDIIQIKDFLQKDQELLKNNLIIQKQTMVNRILAIEKKSAEEQMNQEKEQQKQMNEQRLKTLEEKRQKEIQEQQQKEADDQRRRNDEAEAQKRRNDEAEAERKKNNSSCLIM